MSTAVWSPPENPVEALERALEMARDETKWSYGSWLAFGDSGEAHELRALCMTNQPDEVVYEKFQQCTSIRGCAMTLLAIACLDGKAIKQYFYDSIRRAIESSEIAVQATMYLAMASGAPHEDYRSGYYINHVIEVNDNSSPYEKYSLEGKFQYDRAQHHKDIVSMFERAVELAKAAVVE